MLAHPGTCNGITWEPHENVGGYPGKYTGRKGTDLRDSSSHENSWIAHEGCAPPQTPPSAPSPQVSQLEEARLLLAEAEESAEAQEQAEAEAAEQAQAQAWAQQMLEQEQARRQAQRQRAAAARDEML